MRERANIHREDGGIPLQEIKEVVAGSKLSTEGIENHDIGWVVEDGNGRVVGYIGLERRENYVYIQSLAVRRECRYGGIGSKLVEKAYNFLEKGDVLIALTLFWNNDFYVKCGFKKLIAKEVKMHDDVGGRRKHKYCTAWGRRK